MTVSFLDGKTAVLYPAAGHKILANNVIILGDPIVVEPQEHRPLPRLSPGRQRDGLVQGK